MSTHTMPPLSLLAADFVKSLLKTADTQEKDEAAQTEKTNKPLYNRRKMLNGGAAVFMNGHDGHSTDDDESADEELDADAKVKVKTNETKRNTTNDEDVEMGDEATAMEKRKSFIVKSEAISANAAKSSLAQQRHDNEAQLKRISAFSVELEF